ncbi:lipoprotein [Pantoea sp. Nvir]|uniref:LPS translocon maturation chaperone LptM n=1 Tax=Pantoea sp. Nvir TaxID=2576760 RepID=UPI0013587E02|nr:lipoprotein [Pantoea sp. Nvir]MXP66983.1 hypothetical protein [Pantoea sp. Nvir]
MKTIKRLLAITLASLAGCGLKGPLDFPSGNYQPKTHNSQQAEQQNQYQQQRVIQANAPVLVIGRNINNVSVLVE